MDAGPRGLTPEPGDTGRRSGAAGWRRGPARLGWRLLGRRGLKVATPALTAAGILAISLALAALVWLADRDERLERQQALIKDSLWVEQTLRFELGADLGFIDRLALDIGRGSADASQVAVRARHLVSNSPEIVRLQWLDADDRPALAVPPQTERTAPPPPLTVALELARAGGRAVPSSDFVLANGQAGFALVTPIHRGEAYAGALVATVSLSALLSEHIPWWIVERYRVTVVDVSGRELAARSRVAVPDGSISHTIALDPPARDLFISISTVAAKTNLVRNSLVATIAALALVVAASFLALHRHIQRRIAAESEVRAQHAFRKAMEDSLTVGMRAKDIAGRIIYVNPAFCRMVGFAADELIGQPPPMPYWVPELLDETLAVYRAVLDGRAPPDGFEITFQRRNGEWFDALIYEAPLIDADGRHAGWMASVVDITDRKRAEELSRQQSEQLARTARLVSMGEMASSIAHELNQPLSAVASYATGSLNMIRSGCSGEDIAPAIEKIAEQAQRAGQIVHSIYNVVRRSEPQIAPLDIVALIEEAAAFIAPEARKYGVEVVIRNNSDVNAVPGDRVLLEQVLLNLARNACEAMARTAAEDRRLVIKVERVAAELVFSLADRGPGIAADVLESLFSPFVSTKPEGMGMGLCICRTIIERHHGRLWFEPAEPRGTVFRFVLPLGGMQ
ncbi:sensor histidine kinase [Blastochloris viridis]|uniref:histidine kinase n=1 Tax=Blastochloris viridis TaxID=1079 RepID=A0A0H5B8D8_BLAVI|nr:PAS domain S-box protein [Blastochloris viridis]ALK08284.1 Sensor protein FixL [Blastochloris viridis]BAR98450.1 two-component hybrid sensor and regulator [Blastochloris viridis]CUU44206.1 Sensor protein fixL [Blastochloris viridis]